MTDKRSWDRFPRELREIPHWCVSGPDKRPWDVRGRPASVVAPDTWTDFDTAQYHADLWNSLPGIVLTESDPFVCIDLDVKDDTPDSHIQRFRRIIEQCGSYTELSRSGRGMHIFVRGSVGKGLRRDGVEVYDRRRFIICTGDVVMDLPIVERQSILDAMRGQMSGEVRPEIQLWGDDTMDWSLAERLTLDTGYFGELFRGEWQYRSQSEADLALVLYLLPRTETPRECWNTFRLSALGRRDKAGRRDYARWTVNEAMRRLQANDEALQHGRAIAMRLLNPS